jgi:hypothetical protein
MERFEIENAKLGNDLNGKLQIEACKLSELVQEVKSETGQEPVSVNRSLQGLSKDVDDKLQTQANAKKSY